MSSGMVGGDDSARPGRRLHGAERRHASRIALGTAEVVDQLVARNADHPCGRIGIAPKLPWPRTASTNACASAPPPVRRCDHSDGTGIGRRGRLRSYRVGNAASSAKTAATSTRPSMIAVDGCTELTASNRIYTLVVQGVQNRSVRLRACGRPAAETVYSRRRQRKSRRTKPPLSRLPSCPLA